MSAAKIFKTVALVGTTVVLCIALDWLAYLNNVLLPWDRKEAVETTLTWAGAAPLPEKAKIVKIEIKGGAFSRGFELQFSDSREGITRWIENSAGLTEANLKTTSTDIVEYEMTPAFEGAEFAKIKVDWVNSRVFVTVYWS